MLGISIGLNAVSVHGTCTVVFVAVEPSILPWVSWSTTIAGLTCRHLRWVPPDKL